MRSTVKRNPEIEIVRQFAPEVTAILLGPDPSDYVAQLADCRLFEPRSITGEDAERTSQYRSDAQRKALEATVTDMASYLESLQMEAVISEFTPVDVRGGITDGQWTQMIGDGPLREGDLLVTSARGFAKSFGTYASMRRLPGLVPKPTTSRYGAR